MTLSHPGENRGSSSKKENNRIGNSSQQSAFNLASMKRSLSGTNYNSLLRPLLQPASSTGLEDRPPPPPVPTQMQNRHKRSGLFTSLQSNSNQFSSGYNNSENIEQYGIFEEMQKRDGQQNVINNRRSDEHGRPNLSQSSSTAHQSISNNLTSTSVQQRLHQIQQTKDLGPKPDVSVTVRFYQK